MTTIPAVMDLLNGIEINKAQSDRSSFHSRGVLGRITWIGKIFGVRFQEGWVGWLTYRRRFATRHLLDDR